MEVEGGGRGGGGSAEAVLRGRIVSVAIQQSRYAWRSMTVRCASMHCIEDQCAVFKNCVGGAVCAYGKQKHVQCFNN